MATIMEEMKAVNKLKVILEKNPEAARELLKNPEVANWLKMRQERFDYDNYDENSMNGNSRGGKQLVKAIPGIAEKYKSEDQPLFDGNEHGFSNYVMLAGLAFSIQLIITLICIFFYK